VFLRHAVLIFVRKKYPLTNCVRIGCKPGGLGLKNAFKILARLLLKLFSNSLMIPYNIISRRPVLIKMEGGFQEAGS
jgi:hypothetical protein